MVMAEYSSPSFGRQHLWKTLEYILNKGSVEHWTHTLMAFRKLTK